MNVFRTKMKKNHEAYPHASTNNWELGQTHGPVITGLRSFSVTCAKLVLCLWNKNKILLFLRKVLIFLELVERRTDIQGSIKINSCVPKLVLFCVQISTRVSPVTCYLQSLKFCSLRINSRANWNLNIFFIESLKCFLLKRLKHRQCITHIKKIFWILLSCNRVSPWYLNNWKII